MKTITLNFKEKVQAMTGKEIIMVMVDGLQNPVMKVDMYSFGTVKDGICYGCAATNAICKIADKVFNEKSIYSTTSKAKFIGTDYEFLAKFEHSIDFLRQGAVAHYNGLAAIINIAEIKGDPTTLYRLPILGNNYTPEDLQAYIELANAQ